MAKLNVNEATVQEWLDGGENIEARCLDVLKKNQANDGITDATGYFRKLYYHFHELTDDEIDEYTKILNRFERNKPSGHAGKEVVKNFLGNCLALLSTEESRQSLKKYLDKNGLMPEDNSEEQRRQDEERRRRQEEERQRREEEERRRREEEERRRREEEERRRREEEARRREDDRAERREEERRRRAEEAQRAAEQFEGDIDAYTAQREQYVVDKMKKRKFNIPWKGVLKTLAALLFIVLFFWLISSLKSCIASRSSSASLIPDTDSIEVADQPTAAAAATENQEDDQDFGSPDDGLLGSIPHGETVYTGTMDGYPIEFTVTKGEGYEVNAFYRNVNYHTTMQLSGESLPAQAGDINFYGKENGRDWVFSLTGTHDHMTGTAQQGDKTFQLDLRPKDTADKEQQEQAARTISIQSYNPTPRASICKLLRVVVTASETRIYGVLDNSSSSDQFWWKRTAYLHVEGHDHLTIQSSEGMPIEPGKVYVSPGSKLEFVVIFPPLPAGTTQFDFIESNEQDAWCFFDIKLSEAV